MDSVSVLSDVELQKELSLFANAQFTYDIAPGVAANDDAISPSSSNINAHPHKAKKPDMHSLLNVKLASLAENNYHTSMSPDAIARFYDDSPDCTPPNGYHSPNPSPPNGFHSPNPTPPNGVHLTASSHAGFQGIVNPPITFYGEDAIMGYDDDQFMKTMRLLTNNYDEPQPEAPKPTVAAPTPAKKRNSISKATVKKSSPLVSNELSTVDSEDDDEDADESANGAASRRSSQHQAPLTKEDKRRRNTAASARFRVKKKMREQALQQTANEMTEKAKAFENRVHELEREVKWLKALIVEKKDGHLEQMLMQQYGAPMAAPTNDSSYHSHHQQMNHVAYNNHQHHRHASNNNNNR
ncbi:basic-leucine zipper transcription factor [Mucor lusitanicus CBS 277.49]|uniref:Basic-leucine zipper transcription factor n=2 Tax=Mucor circinelloides f. lusitanicus TaxID=29924 RepID=A0A168MFK3_MUCCL|nr:basic-leucine zipper transcription factor [Mucor lusitanicus CBS 277.49]